MSSASRNVTGYETGNVAIGMGKIKFHDFLDENGYTRYDVVK